MKEDVEIARLVRSALEDGVAVKARTLRALETAAAHEVAERRRRRRTWFGGASLLAAASLTMALFFGNALSVGSAASGLSEVRAVIGFLSAVDGLEEDLTSFSPGEMLLAWQDAPCVGLL